MRRKWVARSRFSKIWSNIWICYIRAFIQPSASAPLSHNVARFQFHRQFRNCNFVILNFAVSKLSMKLEPCHVMGERGTCRWLDECPDVTDPNVAPYLRKSASCNSFSSQPLVCCVDKGEVGVTWSYVAPSFLNCRNSKFAVFRRRFLKLAICYLHSYIEQTFHIQSGSILASSLGCQWKLLPVLSDLKDTRMFCIYRSPQFFTLSIYILFEMFSNAIESNPLTCIITSSLKNWSLKVTRTRKINICNWFIIIN